MKSKNNRRTAAQAPHVNIEVAPGTDLDHLDAVEKEMIEANIEDIASAQDADVVDEAKLAADEAHVRSVKQQAIQRMEEFGVSVTQSAQQMALGIFPKVSSNPLLNTEPS